MLDFAVRATKEVHSVSAETIRDLKEKDLSDEDILNIVQVVGFFNYYTRVADALGVELEPFDVHAHPPADATGSGPARP